MNFRDTQEIRPDVAWRPPVISSAVAMTLYTQVLIGTGVTGCNRFPHLIKSRTSIVSLAQAVQSAVHPPGPAHMGVASFL